MQFFLFLKQNFEKTDSKDLMTLSGGEELDKNHVNRISLEQMNLFLKIGIIFKSVIN
jgi:uncharacterized lipoprotein YehR (DUF1307 family)